MNFINRNIAYISQFLKLKINNIKYLLRYDNKNCHANEILL